MTLKPHDAYSPANALRLFRAGWNTAAIAARYAVPEAKMVRDIDRARKEARS